MTRMNKLIDRKDLLLQKQRLECPTTMSHQRKSLFTSDKALASEMKNAEPEIVESLLKNRGRKPKDGVLRDLVSGWMQKVFETLHAKAIVTDKEFAIDEVTRIVEAYPWDFTKVSGLKPERQEAWSTQVTDCLETNREHLFSLFQYLNSSSKPQGTHLD